MPRKDRPPRSAYPVIRKRQKGLLRNKRTKYSLDIAPPSAERPPAIRCWRSFFVRSIWSPPMIKGRTWARSAAPRGRCGPAASVASRKVAAKVHMTAGHNAFRGSGPGQNPAIHSALARVACPDHRIDRFCLTCCLSLSRRLGITPTVNFMPSPEDV